MQSAETKTGNLQGIVTTLPGHFQQPQDLTVDAAGNIYVVEGTGKVHKMTPTGASSQVAKVGDLAFGITMSNTGNISVASSSDLTITTFSKDFAVLNQTVSSERFTLKGLAVNSKGEFFIVDQWRSTIYKLSPDGKLSPFAGPGKASSDGFVEGDGPNARFRLPNDLAIDQFDNLYVADTGNHAIRKITPDGQVSTIVRQAPTATESSPLTFSALTVDQAGNIYAASRSDNRIRQITQSGEMRILAGSGATCKTSFGPEETSPPYEQCFNDGKGEEARFFDPQGLAVGPDGALYVADTNNGKIRRLE